MENPFELILERLDRIEQLLIHSRNELNKEKVEPQRSKLMNAKELAEYLSLSIATIYGMTHKRVVPFYKQGKRLHFKRDEIDNWINEGRTKSIDEIEKEATDYIIKNQRP